MSATARRAPLAESKLVNSAAANKSISSSFRGGKASLEHNTNAQLHRLKVSSPSFSSAVTESAGMPAKPLARQARRPAASRRAVRDSDDDGEDEEVTIQASEDGDEEESDEEFGQIRRSKSSADKGASARSKPQSKSAQTVPPPPSKSKTASAAQVAHRVAALARSHAVANAGDGSLIMAPRNGRSGGAAGAEATAALSVDTTSFEEWMKMATDNKINSTNTWSFALIDYFHDMSLLRNESGDGSINFQKASCTLDGCVKVWTSRVDSVVVETGKLLSGLQDEINGAEGKDKRVRGGEDGEDADADQDDFDEDVEGGTTKSRKRSRNKEATLAKNFGQIQAKKFDLEFTVDPLFKKTSADFDEGGAGGLLMNHLGVDSNGRVVFDASDVAGVGDEADQNEDLADDEAAESKVDAEVELMDLSKLRSKLLEGQDSSVADLIGGRVICPTLCNFSFSESDDTPFGVGLEDLEGSGAYGGTDADGLARTVETYDGFQDDNMMLQDNGDGADFFSTGGQAAGPSTGGDDDALLGDDDDDGGVDFFDAPEAGDGMDGPGAYGGSMDPSAGATGGGYDPSAGPNQSEIVMALALNGGEAAENDDAPGGEAGVFDYFDRRMMRNWAGPEHWKMSRVGAGSIGLGGINGKKNDEAGARTASGASATRKSKEPFVIDFMSDEGAVNVKEIFEPAKQPGSIQLPSSSRSKVSLAGPNSEAYLLPEDRHFNSRQLLKLFLKPRFAINMRRRGGGQSRVNGDGIDEQFWTQAAAAHAGDGMGGDDFDNGAAMPFDTQFFHDNDDGYDPISSDTGGGEHGSPSDLAATNLEDEDIQTLAALNRVKPEYVNYAKKAKRVDVKKLKENIWKELGIVTEEDGDATAAAAEEADAEVAGDSSNMSIKAKREFKTFNTVLDGLKKAYPKDKMEEISTSFCFICLLHLANEEGLQISTGSEDQPRPKRRTSAGRNRNSTTPTPSGHQDDEAVERSDADGMASMFEQLASGAGGARIVRSSEDDDNLGGEGWDEEDEEDAEDRIKVGVLESLRIVKDPKAFRSA